MEDDVTLPVPKPTPSAGGDGLASDGVTVPGSGARNSSSQGWQPPSVEEMQKLLPQYHVTRFLARGGMGAVYEGVQKSLDRRVAIKILPPDIEDNDIHFAERFKAEAKAMAKLAHPGIVAVFDAGETAGGLLYFVMELVEGTDVAQMVSSEGRLSAVNALNIIAQVCEALGFAHEEGIIHRDIKPSNIMVDKKGRVKVADFGLAKVTAHEGAGFTKTNTAMGTPDFIAPEALMPGMQVDQRADLYAVGVMLYQMLTGRVPRGRFQLPSVVVQELEARLDAIVDKAMQTDRERRYSTAIEMKADVERVATAPHPNPLPQGARKPESAQPSSPSPQLGEGRGEGSIAAKSRKPLLIGLGTAAAVILSVTAWMLMDKPTKTEGSAVTAKAPPASAPAWQKLALPDAATLRSLAGASLTPAGELVAPSGLNLPGIKGRNMGIRGELKRLATNDKHVGVGLRIGGAADGNGSPAEGAARASRQFALHPKNMLLQIARSNNEFPNLSKVDYPSGVDIAKDWVPFEFVVIGEASLASVAGRLILLEGRSPEALGEGDVQIMGAQFRNLEMIQLDSVSEAEALRIIQWPPSQVATKPSPSASTTAAAQADAIWKSRWSKQGKLRAVGVDAAGNAIDLRAAEPYADFVLVVNLGHVTLKKPGARAWLALRSNGEALWSNGTVEKGIIGLQGTTRILSDGTVASELFKAPEEPVLQLNAAYFDGLPDRPWAVAWQRLDDTWKVSSPGFAKGTLEQPDLVTPPRIKKVLAQKFGVAVLREDATLRMWGVKELKLPTEVTTGIQDVVEIGTQLAVLNKDDVVFIVQFTPPVRPGEPPTIAAKTAARGAKAMAVAGFAFIYQLADGSWISGSHVSEDVRLALDQLNTPRIEQFSLAFITGKGSLIWIEPVK